MPKIVRCRTDRRESLDMCYQEIEGVVERYEKAYGFNVHVQILSEEESTLAAYPYRVHYVLTYRERN